MTRFARAKGSKSSNSRSADDATDWRELKRQPKKPTTNSSNEYSAIVKKTIKQIKEGGPPKASGWAEFGAPAPQTTPESKEKSSKSGESHGNPKGKRNRKQKKSVGDKGDEGAKNEAKPNEPEKSSEGDNTNGKSKRKQNRKQKKSVEDEEDEGAKKKAKLDEPEKSSQSQENSTSNESNPNKNGKFQKGNQSSKKPKTGIKLPDGTYKRRKPHVESQTLQVNGSSIHVTKFDGYDVTHADAVRLTEIRKKMREAKIPKDEIYKAMLKERRNAEKALKRMKKDVCFNCRKAGHPLSECPELNSGEFMNAEKTGTSNICYKCGSTEHTHYQCQVKKNKEYSFATCFICKEQGHISSQCPDNPKGLYPKGGSCKVCGEVTHLKKDCPQLAKDRSENVVTLDTFSSNSNVESLEEHRAKPFNNTPKQKKIIKF